MEKLSHAYIVASSSEALARKKAIEIAKTMLCSGEGSRPCNECKNCRKVDALVHPDLSFISRLVDDKGNKKRIIGVEQIRQMVADASVLPNEAECKVYIIEEAETMNENAQNAALKLFEEPPKGVAFILCTTNPERLLITVRSRCAFVRVNRGEEEEDAQLGELADEYLAVLDKGNAAELAAWCMENESLEGRRVPDFLNCVNRKLIQELRYADNKKRIMENIELVERCLKYAAVNTSAKNIFGLLAVKSLPAKETRKKVD